MIAPKFIEAFEPFLQAFSDRIGSADYKLQIAAKEFYPSREFANSNVAHSNSLYTQIPPLIILVVEVRKPDWFSPGIYQ